MINTSFVLDVELTAIIEQHFCELVPLTCTWDSETWVKINKNLEKVEQNLGKVVQNLGNNKSLKGSHIY